MKELPQAILFYDGNCGLCNHSVRFLLKRDHNRLLHFAPIQGETAQKYLAPELRDSLSTAIYQRLRPCGDREILLRSEAVLCALIDIQSSWRYLAYPARWLPLSWRDGIYNWVARNRDRFFTQDTCDLPAACAHKQLLP